MPSTNLPTRGQQQVQRDQAAEHALHHAGSIGGLVVRAGGHVPVDGEGEPGTGVAEALGDEVDRHAVGEQQGHVDVSEVVQPDGRQLLLP